MTLWVILIGCWLAVAAERYFKRTRAKNAKEHAFIAESIDAAYEAKRQREMLKQTVERAAAAEQSATDADSG